MEHTVARALLGRSVVLQFDFQQQVVSCGTPHLALAEVLARRGDLGMGYASQWPACVG